MVKYTRRVRRKRESSARRGDCRGLWRREGVVDGDSMFKWLRSFCLSIAAPN